MKDAVSGINGNLSTLTQDAFDEGIAGHDAIGNDPAGTLIVAGNKPGPGAQLFGGSEVGLRRSADFCHDRKRRIHVDSGDRAKLLQMNGVWFRQLQQ